MQCFRGNAAEPEPALQCSNPGFPRESKKQNLKVLNYKIMIITLIINIAVNSLYTNEIAIPQLLQAGSGERLCSTHNDHLR